MATAAVRLEQARAARHKLITGQMARVFMDQNGERVEFTQTNIANLDRYIRELEAEVSPSAARLKAPRPIGFTF
jgi:hypothetical protein